jgi:glutathione synthase/RimK-type ligase-like ATP-grasp enzyme
MPFGLDIIRKLGRSGHRVFAADTFRAAPGSHSRYVTEAIVTASPRYETARFIAQLEEIIVSRSIDMLLPAFEEALYIARHLEVLAPLTEVMVAPFDVTLRLHDKASFVELAGHLGLPVPPTTVVTSRDELRDAIGAHDEYLARPAFSRGALELLTNAGSRAGETTIEQCHPTTARPWLVQPFFYGQELCSYSIVHKGQVAAHSAYINKRQIEHGGAIVFESVSAPETLEVAQTIAKATDYTGQLHFDFLRGDDGYVVVECNPRATTGVILLSDEAFTRALGDRHPIAPRLTEPGVQRQYSMALVRDMLLHWNEAANDLRHLLSSARDVYAEPGDLLPALYQLLSYSLVASYWRRAPEEARRHQPLLEAYFDDILYNGPSDEAEHWRQRAAERQEATAACSG